MTRAEAFMLYHDTDWQPKVNDRVFVRCKRGTLSWHKGTGTVTATTADPDIVRVKITYGKQQSNDQWLVSDLRPYSK